jgi:hypothetical protein
MLDPRPNGLFGTGNLPSVKRDARFPGKLCYARKAIAIVGLNRFFSLFLNGLATNRAID